MDLARNFLECEEVESDEKEGARVFHEDCLGIVTLNKSLRKD